MTFLLWNTKGDVFTSNESGWGPGTIKLKKIVNPYALCVISQRPLKLYDRHSANK